MRGSVVSRAGFRHISAPIERGNVTCGRRIRFSWHNVETFTVHETVRPRHGVAARGPIPFCTSHDEALTLPHPPPTTKTKLEHKIWLLRKLGDHCFVTSNDTAARTVASLHTLPFLPRSISPPHVRQRQLSAPQTPPASSRPPCRPGEYTVSTLNTKSTHPAEPHVVALVYVLRHNQEDEVP